MEPIDVGGQLVGDMLRAMLHETEETKTHVPGRKLQLASGFDIATRMLRMGRVQRPPSMHRVVAEAMTIRETSFFRDLQPFQYLSDRILPNLIAKRPRERFLRLWSAGCATGQEAYSLAMVLLDRFPELEEWDVRIVGTDISKSACEYARRGCYSRLEINRGLPARLMLRYFERYGEEWRACEGLRRMVTFECADLCALTPERPSSSALTFDVVLLRNVLFYFSREERASALAVVYARMQPRAALLLGASEQVDDAPDLFQAEFDWRARFIARFHICEATEIALTAGVIWGSGSA